MPLDYQIPTSILGPFSVCTHGQDQILNGEVVATGGFLLLYNKPFADLYMEVREDCRRRGIASFLMQELKKECYLAGRVPAARCELRNVASRAALLKAGFCVCGFVLMGEIERERR
jgi:GNAT superfamily N-acetyltransferase